MPGPDPAAVRAFFDTGAYLHHNPLIPVRAALVRALLPNVAGGRILDLGCGDGSLSLPFATEGNHVTLVDFSSKMLDRARTLTPPGTSVEFVQGDLLECPLGSDYDVVLCIGVLAHVSSAETTVARVANALRPGGACVVQITDDGRPVGWLLNRYARLRLRRARAMNVMSTDSLIALLARFGLSPKGSRRYGLSIPGGAWLPFRTQYRIEAGLARSRLLSACGSELLLLAEKRVIGA